MNPNTFYRSILFIAGLSLFLSSCFSDKEANPASPKNTLVTLGAEPTFIEGALTYQYTIVDNSFELTVEPEYCKSDGSLAAPYTRQYFFQISDGELLTWKEGDCFAEVYSGTGSQLENTTWKYTGTTDIPVGANSSTLCQFYPDDYGDGFGLSEEIFMSNGTYTNKQYGDYCWSEGESGENSTSDGCNRLIASTPAGTITTTLIAQDLMTSALKGQMEYNGITCTIELPPRVEYSEAVCKAAYEAWQSDPEAEERFDDWDYVNPDRTKANEDFEACLEANNFPDLSNDDEE